MAFHHWLLLFFFFSIGCGRPVEKYEMFDFSLENEIWPWAAAALNRSSIFLLFFLVLFFILFCLLHTISVWDISPPFFLVSLSLAQQFLIITHTTHTHTHKREIMKSHRSYPPHQHHPHHFSPFSWRMSHSPGLGLGVSRSARKRCCRAHLISFFCFVRFWETPGNSKPSVCCRQLSVKGGRRDVRDEGLVSAIYNTFTMCHTIAERGFYFGGEIRKSSENSFLILMEHTDTHSLGGPGNINR